MNKTHKYFEITAVLLTAIGKFVFMDWLNWRFQFVVIAILFWSTYVIYRYRKQPSILRYWGFRWYNFWSTLKMMMPFAVLSILLFFCVGYFQGTINMTWHLIPILILYPIWGSVQQFLCIALMTGNLNEIKVFKAKRRLVILLTAVLFALVHYPITWLMIGTFFLALFYGYIYLKSKNIFTLGAYHGWLGGLYYYTVVGTDPFADVFLVLLK